MKKKKKKVGKGWGEIKERLEVENSKLWLWLRE